MHRSTPLIVLTGCLALPPLGAWLAGRTLALLGRFPPPLELPSYPAFSWWAAALVGAVAGAVAWPWLRRGGSRRATVVGGPAGPNTVRRFPWWGWAGIVWVLGWWLLAWTRFAWFGALQRYTFTPLWLGFIVVVNALTWRQRGQCLLSGGPARVARLFAASAAFWWVFEYLNRFVRNWHYYGAEGVGAAEYAVHASVCFATVLPAVASVRELLGGWPRLQARLAGGPCWTVGDRPAVGGWLVVLAAAGLVFTGAQPVYGYPALWAAPLLLAVGLALRQRSDGWWRQIAHGDWRAAGSWALAALICGGVWELWNYHSLAKWVYTVPFLHRWLIFEMPLPGYTGYLTFGLECAIAVAWIDASGAESEHRGSPASANSSPAA